VKRYLFLGVGIVIGLAVVLMVSAMFFQSYNYHGSVIDPPIQAPNFTLTDTNGESWELSDQKGDLLLIFFGYTSCPDVCPLTLSEFKQIKAILGENAKDVEFIYITVDPERDTPEKLKAYLSNFDPDFVGLSGAAENLVPVWKSYGVYHQKVETESQAGYLVDHTATIYGINKNGELSITFPFGMEVKQIVDDIEHMLNE
jgi:protein SCO1/2